MQVYSFFPVYWKVVDRYWKGEERELSLLCFITPQLPREGGRKDTLMREYTTVEVEDIVRSEMKSDGVSSNVRPREAVDP